MKTGKLALALSLIATQTAFADTTPSPTPSPSLAPACQVLRTAKAKVYVTRVSLTQQNGTWVDNTQLVCSSTADINVVNQSVTGCPYSTALTCDTLLDGNMHQIRVSGLVYFYNPTTPSANNPPKKEFAVSYYIDRNNGETGFAAATTFDLNQLGAGVNMDSSRVMSASGTAYDDAINLNVTFDDSDATK